MMERKNLEDPDRYISVGMPEIDTLCRQVGWRIQKTKSHNPGAVPDKPDGKQEHSIIMSRHKTLSLHFTPQ